MRAFCKIYILCLAAFFSLHYSPLWAQLGLFDDNQSGGSSAGPTDAKEIVKLDARFTAPTATQPAILFITADIKRGWHIYSITQPPGGPVKTQIQLAQSPQYRLAGRFQSQPAPKKETQPEAFGDLVVESHYKSVTWFAPLELAPGLDAAGLRISGNVTVQPCDANTCLPPQPIGFTAALGRGIELSPAQVAALTSPRGAQPPEGPSQIPLGPAPSPGAALPSPSSPAVVNPEEGMSGSQASAEKLDWRPFTMASFKRLAGPMFDEVLLKEDIQGRLKAAGLWREMLLGFIGGIILNLMPCVLPVIGLKILAFVEQSRENRWHGFLLNFWYSAGLIAVFLLLAALAVFAKLGWGQLFQYPAFNVAMAAVVFVMGLSFLGVWEIPIPGFIGSGKTAELAQREGFGGAFAKGVITTILATPCTGPFMASALAWAVTQPPQNTFLIFTSIGLGMASPYLLIGAVPELIRFLPKPGAWMDTFKHVMGFVLMATVVYIFTFLEWAYIVPAVGLLMAFWAGCWWIGRTPLYADLDAKLRAWTQAGVFVAAVWVLMFPGLAGLSGGRIDLSGLYGVMQSRLDDSYERKIQRHLEELQQQGYQLVRNAGILQSTSSNGGLNTIMVDFTADWCATCKTLEATVLSTQAVFDKVRQNGVVTMKADWTNGDPQVTAMLDLLGGRSVPTLAIFPAKRPNKPIVIRGTYTRQYLLEALDEAGPSIHEKDSGASG